MRQNYDAGARADQRRQVSGGSAAASHSEVARIEAELANAESHTNVIELHPQAVQRFKENIESLAEILADRDSSPDLALIGSFRSLVEAVIVQPRKAGEEYEVRIRGRLAALMGAEVSAMSSPRHG